MANVTPEPSPKGMLPTEGKLERLAPSAFVVLGLGMVALAAADYLSSSVAVGFVVLGAGLVALGGLAARVEGTVKLGLQGFEFALRARQALVEAQQQAQERDPEEAERLAGEVEEIDDWFEQYRQTVQTKYIASPFIRAALLKDAWQRQHPPPPESRD